VVKTTGITDVAVLAAIAAGGPPRGDDGHPRLDEIGSHRRQSIVSTVGPAIRDRDIPALNETCLAEASAVRSYLTRETFRRPAVEKADHRHRRLLRARRERPRCRNAAEQSDELAPLQLTELHSVPSSVAGYRIGEDQVRGVAAMRDFGAAYGRFGSNPEVTVLALMSASASCRHHELTLTRLPANLGAQDAKAIFRVVVGDPLDEAR
jgi:hypothetical protein